MPSKNRPLSSACCSSLPFSGCMHGGILRLLSPQGTSLKSFSVNFHPLPNSDEPFLPPTPQWRICPRSLCPPLTSFFDCSLSCRQHAAYANTHSFIRETPPLNECNLKWGHTFAEGVLHALSDTQSLEHWHKQTDIMELQTSVCPDRWTTEKIEQEWTGGAFIYFLFYKTGYTVICWRWCCTWV